MLTHPTIERLVSLKLTGMARALQEQMHMPEIDSLSFEERLGLLVDRELTDRENRRLKDRLSKAKLRQNAAIEDIDYRHSRGLDRALFTRLASVTWIGKHQNVLIIGPTGCGKTFVACALAQKACREGYGALYTRMPRLFHDLHIAKADGRYGRLLTGLARTELLVFDDWGLSRLTDEQRHDLLEILEDRHGLRSTIVASQFPVDTWHEMIGEPTLADAILDRLIHNAHKINLKGDSMRRRKQPLTDEEVSE